ncbi:MAG: hypothetical protein PHI96_10170 [Desulfovibrio sp.]|nr:hypothetical protein [Desulfovibrio sp.]
MASHAWKNKVIEKIFIKFVPPIKPALQIYREYGVTLRTNAHVNDFFMENFFYADVMAKNAGQRALPAGAQARRTR